MIRVLVVGSVLVLVSGAWSDAFACKPLSDSRLREFTSLPEEGSAAVLDALLWVRLWNRDAQVRLLDSSGVEVESAIHRVGLLGTSGESVAAIKPAHELQPSSQYEVRADTSSTFFKTGPARAGPAVIQPVIDNVSAHGAVLSSRPCGSNTSGVMVTLSATDAISLLVSPSQLALDWPTEAEALTTTSTGAPLSFLSFPGSAPGNYSFAAVTFSASGVRAASEVFTVEVGEPTQQCSSTTLGLMPLAWVVWSLHVARRGKQPKLRHFRGGARSL